MYLPISYWARKKLKSRKNKNMSSRNVKYELLTIEPESTNNAEPGKIKHIMTPRNIGFVLLTCVFVLVFVYASEARRTPNYSYTPYSLQTSGSHQDNRWTYVCKNEKCVREKHTEGNNLTSLATCNVVCTEPQVWPMPRLYFAANNHAVHFLADQIKFATYASEQVENLLHQAYSIFMQNIMTLTSPVEEWLQTSNINRFHVSVFVKSDSTQLKLETNESYDLSLELNSVGEIVANITAATYFGARHGLETLSQQIWWDEFQNGGMLTVLTSIVVKDSPKFPYRGLMIDTARNFFPIEKLKEVVDGMAASKLNVLHLHLTDSTSFSISLPRASDLGKNGAYSPEMIYKVDDIKSLKEYARIRGVRLLLEVDAPSHVNSGWEREDGEEKIVICGEDDIFKGQLNPDNPDSLDVLEKIYSDLLEFNEDNQLFHIGGDEVDLNCWQRTQSAKNYTDMRAFWADYVSKMIGRLRRANKGELPENIILWSSPLTDTARTDLIDGHENIVVQFWYGQPRPILESRHKVIFSTVGRWYLDCGFGRWRPSMRNGVCDPYTPWQTFYEYKPWVEYAARDLTLGGEVCLWTEQVEVDSLHTRLWPRTAAFAERIWSDPENTNEYDVYTRLVSQRDRLVKRGLPAAAMWPKYCSLNPGKCK